MSMIEWAANEGVKVMKRVENKTQEIDMSTEM